MDPVTLFVLGGFLILIGFLNLIRSRFLSARRRLLPAASIRGGAAYRSPQPAVARGLSFILMLGGGAIVLAGILMG